MYHVVLLFLILLCSSSVESSVKVKLAGAHWRAAKELEPIALLRGIDPLTLQWKCLGTAVLVDFDKSYENLFLITNRHIFVARDSFKVEMRAYNRNDSILVYEEFSFQLTRPPAFCPSTGDSDFVAIPIPRAEASEKHLSAVKYSDMARYEDLNLGDDVEFYGYPRYDSFGFSGDEFNLPILRRGTISFFAVREFFKGQDNFLLKGEILIDGISMGGNSGGPVFLRLQPMTIPQKGPYRRYMFGIIRGHFGSNDPIVDTSVLVGPVTSVSPVRPAGNAGIAIVVPMKMIDEFVRDRMSRLNSSKSHGSR